jgi:hypothetical protein
MGSQLYVQGQIDFSNQLYGVGMEIYGNGTSDVLISGYSDHFGTYLQFQTIKVTAGGILNTFGIRSSDTYGGTIIESGGTWTHKGDIYDNSTSGLTSTYVQDAIDELESPFRNRYQTNNAQPYIAGQLSYDPVTKTHLADTGYSGVRVNIGQEQHVRFYNDTGSIINNGSVINAQGIDATNGIIKGILADSSSPATSSAVIGVSTSSVGIGEVGVATLFGEVNELNTSLLTTGPLYLSDTTPGGLTNTRPKYPCKIIIIGSVEIIHATTGRILTQITPYSRVNVSATTSFTSQGIGAGTFYKNGFYDWGSTSFAASQASPSVTYGAAGRTQAAHVGIVPSGPGTVDTGQVGIRVTGTKDSETGVQVAAQTETINDDITTLVADEMEETLGKFSGNVTIELYVVSGAPTAYSLSFNYGFSKYEDFFNRDATILGLQAQWQGNANDSNFNIRLLHHKREGWTYAATSFDPGDGAICERLVDQAIESDVDTSAEGAYKRLSLDTFIASGSGEGIITEITTTQNNTIQTADIYIAAVSEELV